MGEVTKKVKREGACKISWHLYEFIRMKTNYFF